MCVWVTFPSSPTHIALRKIPSLGSVAAALPLTLVTGLAAFALTFVRITSTRRRVGARRSNVALARTAASMAAVCEKEKLQTNQEAAQGEEELKGGNYIPHFRISGCNPLRPPVSFWRKDSLSLLSVSYGLIFDALSRDVRVRPFYPNLILGIVTFPLLLVDGSVSPSRAPLPLSASRLLCRYEQRRATSAL